MSNGVNYRDPRMNIEGYPDPTPYEVIKNDKSEYTRMSNLLNIIYGACRLAGFRVEEHIVLKDLKTGKVYR